MSLVEIIFANKSKEEILSELGRVDEELVNAKRLVLEALTDWEVQRSPEWRKRAQELVL
jgi:hypothetical protein